jgi:hypothetical protein
MESMEGDWRVESLEFSHRYSMASTYLHGLHGH